MTEMFCLDELLPYNEHHALFIVVVTYWPILFSRITKPIMLLNTVGIRQFLFSTFDPFLAGLKFSEEGSVELVGDGRLLEELDPLLLSPYHVNGTQCGREEDRSAKDLVFADFCSISLTVLFKRKEQEYALDYKRRENKMPQRQLIVEGVTFPVTVTKELSGMQLVGACLKSLFQQKKKACSFDSFSNSSFLKTTYTQKMETDAS